MFNAQNQVGITERRISCNRMENRSGGVDLLNVEVSLDFFPDWLLPEIFSRLPIKSVFRCKCVSKYWRSVISDPSFARFYISRVSPAAVSHCQWAFIPMSLRVEGFTFRHYPHYERLEDVDSGNLTIPGCYILPIPDSQEAKKDCSYRVRAVSNGFVLYGWAYVTFIDEYYMCNPITKQWFTLPPAPKYLGKVVSEGFIARVEADILTSYKVVLLHCPGGWRTFLELEVFSSETGKWVAYSFNLDRPVMVSYIKRAVYLNNNLHWESRGLGIIAYDPYNHPDKFRIIGFPDGFDKPRSQVEATLCDVHQGRLALCAIDSWNDLCVFSDFKIWVLKDYKTDNWYLQHRIKRDNIVADDNLIFRTLLLVPTAFHPYDADIIFLALEAYDLVSYNLRTGRMEAFSVQRRLEERNKRNAAHSWPPCFLVDLPLWPVCIAPSLTMKRSNNNRRNWWNFWGSKS